MPTQNQSDDFDFVVAAATEQQPQQNLMQQQQTVAGIAAAPEQRIATQSIEQQEVIQPQPQINENSLQQANFFNQTQQVQPQPVIAPQPQVQEQPEPEQKPEEEKPEEEQKLDLDSEIDKLLDELNLNKTDSKNDEIEKILEKNKKISMILSEVSSERDQIKDELWQERYEKQQLEIVNKRLQNKLEELTEANTALKYDENKMEVSDPIKDFVVFYDKWSKNRDKESPDSQLTKRTLAEAVKVIEGITNLSLDNYITEYYNRNNPQMPRVWSNHYWVDQLGFDPLKAQKDIEAKKSDPNWNPMVDVF